MFGFALHVSIVGKVSTNYSQLALLLFLSGDQLDRVNCTLSDQGSVHSDSVSKDDCGRVVHELRVSPFS